MLAWSQIESSSSQLPFFPKDFQPVLVDLFQELSPSPLKKSPHTVSCTSNVRIILIELFTVLKNQVNINDKCLQIQVSENENTSLIKMIPDQPYFRKKQDKKNPSYWITTAEDNTPYKLDTSGSLRTHWVLWFFKSNEQPKKGHTMFFRQNF